MRRRCWLLLQMQSLWSRQYSQGLRTINWQASQDPDSSDQRDDWCLAFWRWWRHEPCGWIHRKCLQMCSRS
jgi:hypothetical protein